MKLTGAKYGSIFIPTEDGGLERVYASSPLLFREVPGKGGYTAQVLENKNYYLLDVKKFLEPKHPSLKELKVKDDLAIVLNYNNLRIGVLSLLSFQNKGFGDGEVKLMKLFAPLATLALQKSILYEQVKTALDAQDLFISTASHELKTPLTSLLLYSQLIEKSVSKKEVPKSEYIQIVLRQEKRLVKLVKEMLAIHQIRTGRLKFEMKKCNLKEVILHSILDSQKLLADHKVKFYNRLKEESAYVNGDGDKLVHVINNLLSNAVKYSAPQAKIDIVLKPTDNSLIFQVKDYGQGIPQRELPYIFEKFYQGSGMKDGGMGLGLYLVRYIVETHKGEITIDSKLGEGTMVTIKLPRLKTNG